MKGEFDFTIEVVILLVLTTFMLLFGFLLFGIARGLLPYNPDSTYGLFLVIVSFQVVTMGKTPFGDFRRSWLLVAAGISTAILGAAACFVPGYLTWTARVLVGVILVGGGSSLLLQLLSSEQKATSWMRIGGILTQLAVACALVYVLTVVLGVITLVPGIVSDQTTAILLIAYGSALAYLSWCVWAVRQKYPEDALNQNIASGKGFSLFFDVSLPLSAAILILLGVIITCLGAFLFPINFGVLPFSPDGQLGLLLTVMAIQTMSLGETPVGRFKRSWPIISIGLAFAALGVLSSIVPGVLTGIITVLLGILNVTGGGLFLAKRYLPTLRGIRRQPAAAVALPPGAANLGATQTALNWVALIFGVSTLASGLLPGLVVAGILVVNGLLLIRLASELRQAIGAARVAGPLPESF